MTENKRYWAKVVAKIIKTELSKRDMTYKDLMLRLQAIGINKTETDLRARISRGTFGAMLFIQCMRAMGIKNVLLEESYFEEQGKADDHSSAPA